MRKIVVELTNRCTLRCQHCPSGRHGGGDDLSVATLGLLLRQAHENGFDEIAFTGGDPTVHPAFSDVVHLTADSGYRFGLVTNGVGFQRALPALEACRQQLAVITFSLDGATEAIHDGIRGKSSYRRVMQAVTLCVIKELPFTFNMVLTARNRHEIGEMAQLAEALGSQGLRLGHLMPTPETGPRGLDLSPAERREVETEVRLTAKRSGIPVGMAPGFHTDDLFPCAALASEEINVDCFGNVTLCCHLSGHGAGAGSRDVAGNLQETSFPELLGRLAGTRGQLRTDKAARAAKGELRDSDRFPCWYCSLHFDKVNWLKERSENPWSPLMWDTIGSAGLVQIVPAGGKETYDVGRNQ
jgi:MoaA/NifB/PqqE/SkfB family radical SAM enzyme